MLHELEQQISTQMENEALRQRICDLTACEWPDTYTVIPMRIGGEVYATSAVIKAKFDDLHQQLAAAKSESNRRLNLLNTLDSDNEMLRGQLAECKKDAERYQLRYETVRALFGNASPSDIEIDAAIDTAMEKQNAKS